MFWFYLGQSGQESNLANVYIGGWRYDESIAGNSETQISSEPIDISYGVDLTIYRDGITHYMVLNYGENLDETIKYTYDVPLFEDKPTYPGIFGQNQVLIGTNYEASNDANVVDEKLKSFQVAESISINNIDNRLIKGKTYKITSTVLPNYTIDKSATYSLVNEVSGVSITNDGLLTISESASNSEIEVKVTSNSNKEVSATKIFNIIDEPTNETILFKDGLTINDPEINDNEIVTKDGDTYVPLNIKGDKWMVSATFRTTKANEEYGIMSTINGYGEYVRYGVNTSFSVDSSIYFDELNGNKEEVSAVANGLLSSERNELSLFKDGNTYYLFINGNLSKRFTSTLNEETTPVLYSSTSLTINNVSVITEENELTNILNSNPYFIGRYVTKNNNEYVVRKTDLGTATDINWPPVNDYATGIKSTKSYDTNFEISFKMKDIDPLVLGNGDIDSKILVYLKSERVSCSLQFVIKKYDGVNPSVKFCANLNDATWDEYDLPSEFDLMNNETEIRIVRTDLEVELYINGTRVFENERFMRNSNYWGKTTVATPGIGTFKCGVTIVDPQIKVSE